MNNPIPDRYQLAADFEQRATNFSFPAEVWNVAAALLEVSEPTSPFELAKVTRLNSDQVQEALRRLLVEKLVRQNLITWKQFSDARNVNRSAAKPIVGGVSPLVSANPVPVATTPSVRLVSQAPAPAPNPSQEGVGARLGTIVRKQAVASSTNAWVLQKPNPVQVAASKPVISPSLPEGEPIQGRLLRPMLEQIENIKGGGVEGQLLVYQVFLRVPYQLLHDEGIKSLHFVDERTVIQSPTLHAAIVKAAKDVAGIDLA